MKTQKNITADTALQRLQRLCVQSEQCRFDLDGKLRRWGFPETVRRSILNALARQKFFDDARYCAAFIHDKAQYNHWGRRKIEAALWQKRIGEDIHGPLLDTVSEDVWIGSLRPLVAARRRSATGKTPYERTAKVVKYALMCGFQLDLIKRVLAESRQETGDIDDIDDVFTP